MRPLSVLLVLVVVTRSQGGFNTYTREELIRWREEVREMFQHSYNSYPGTRGSTCAVLL